MSVWHRPEASIRTRTSSAPGSGYRNLEDFERLVKLVTTDAFMVRLLVGCESEPRAKWQRPGPGARHQLELHHLPPEKAVAARPPSRRTNRVSPEGTEAR